MCVCFSIFILMIKNRTLESRRSEIVQVQWYAHPRIIFLYRDSIISHKCKKVFSLERIFIRGKVSGKIRLRARVCVCVDSVGNYIYNKAQYSMAAFQ